MAMTNVGRTKQPTMVVDSKDKLLFLDDGVGYVQVFHEDHMDAAISAIPYPITPGQPHPAPVGLSWYGPSDQLLLTTAGDRYYGATFASSAYPGMAVIAYDIPASLKSKQWTPLWTVDVNQCQHHLNPWFSSVGAQRSEAEDALFIPCQISPLGAPPPGSLPSQKSGVVKIELGSNDSLGRPCPPGAAPCPNGTVAVAPSPGLINDFTFDARSGRGFSPQTFPASEAVTVYDGRLNAFVGKADIGKNSNVGFGLDDSAGRLYAFSGDGLYVIDGRRTPVAPGTTYPDIKSTADYTPLTAIPSGGGYATTRIPVAVLSSDGLTWPYFQVYADHQAVSQDPPPGSVDANTLTGAPPPGATLSSSYSAGARGYGVHDDFVGGPANAIDNAIPPVVSGSLPCGSSCANSQLPFGRGNRDLLPAVVEKISIGDGTASGVASALDPGDQNTTQDYTNATKSADGSGGHPWPYPQTICSAPGPIALQSPPPTKGSSETPGQPDGATAYVDCVHSGGPTGSAHFGGAEDGGPGGFPSVGYGPSQNTSTVMPPTSVAGSRSVSDSAAKGVVIQLPGGSGALTIGEVHAHAEAAAAGRAGSATASYEREIGNVRLTIGGQTSALCASTCPDLATTVRQINQALVGYVEVLVPTPDPRYYHDAAGAPISHGPGLGSPGGYQAVIEADINQQYGDQKFNQMGSAESTFLPALRIVTYSPGDGNPSLNRHILDLAGTQVEAALGISALSGVSDLAGADVGRAASDAGIPAGTQVPGSSTYVAGDPYVAGGPGTAGSSGVPGGPGSEVINGLTGLVARVFDGLRWLMRRPWEALQLGATVLLLALPYLLMDRRRIWVKEVFSPI